MKSNEPRQAEATLGGEHGTCVIDGRQHQLTAKSLDVMRGETVELVRNAAAGKREDFELTIHESDGDHVLSVTTDGTVLDITAERANGRPQTAADTTAPVQALPPAGGTPRPEAHPHDGPPVTFLRPQRHEAAAREGWRGTVTRLGFRMKPGQRELIGRANTRLVSQHWPQPHTIVIANGKGGAGKTPTVALLAALFARNGGAPVLAWDANQTRGTLGWRTEQGPHTNTSLDLLPNAEWLLGAQA